MSKSGYHIEFNVMGEPVPVPKMKFNRHSGKMFFRDKDGTKRGWMDEVKRVALEMLGDGSPFDKGVPLSLWMQFYLTKPKKCKRDYPTVKPDLDNLAYGVTNALKGVVYADDNQITSMRYTKEYVDNPVSARVYVHIRLATEEMTWRK